MGEVKRDVRIHIVPRIAGVPDVSFVRYYDGKLEGEDTLFSGLPHDFAYQGFTLEAEAKDADYFLIAHPVRATHGEMGVYIQKAQELAASYGKPLLLFAAGDYQHEVIVPGAVVLKASQYRHLMQPNEILIPCSISNFSEEVPFTVRTKSTRPVVSFCGYSSFTSFWLYLKYLLKVWRIECEALVKRNPILRVQQRGLYWRRKSMAYLRQDTRIDTHFIMRRSFSLSAKLVSKDPELIRREYRDTMVHTDFALAPKGDANISLRFYEALSMGRIPILIDTDVVLPFEDTIDYTSCVIRVPYQNLASIGSIVVDAYAAMSEERFASMQRAARDIFRNNLRYDAFFNQLFTSSILKRAAVAADTARAGSLQTHSYPSKQP